MLTCHTMLPLENLPGGKGRCRYRPHSDIHVRAEWVHRAPAQARLPKLGRGCGQPPDAFSVHEKAHGAQHYKLLLLDSVKRLVLCQVDFLLITCLVFLIKFFPLFVCVTACLCVGWRWASGIFLLCSITCPLYKWRRDPVSPRAPHMLVLLASLPWGAPASTCLGWNSSWTTNTMNRIS